MQTAHAVATLATMALGKNTAAHLESLPTTPAGATVMHMLSAARMQRIPEANALLTSVAASLASTVRLKSFVVKGARVDASSLALVLRLVMYRNALLDTTRLSNMTPLARG